MLRDYSTLHISCFLLDYSVLPTCISNSDNLLQDLLSEGTQQSLHNHAVVCAGCESYQGGGGGCTWQPDLNKCTEENFVGSCHMTRYGLNLKTLVTYLEHLLVQFCDGIARQHKSVALSARVPGNGGPGLGFLWHACVIIKCGACRHV